MCSPRRSQLMSAERTQRRARKWLTRSPSRSCARSTRVIAKWWIGLRMKDIQKWPSNGRWASCRQPPTKRVLPHPPLAEGLVRNDRIRWRFEHQMQSIPVVFNCVSGERLSTWKRNKAGYSWKTTKCSGIRKKSDRVSCSSAKNTRGSHRVDDARKAARRRTPLSCVLGGPGLFATSRNRLGLFATPQTSWNTGWFATSPFRKEKL